MDSRSCICILGATATGKSDVGQSIAEAIGGQIVSADSMQVYKGMDIGTAKVPLEERTIPYHCIDLIEPGETYSASLYQNDARSAIGKILEEGSIPVMVGGTGFYIRAALDDYDFPKGEQVNNPIRGKYEAYLDEKGAQALWDLLHSMDARSAVSIHPNNSKRVIRALELAEQGISYSDQLEQLPKIGQWLPAVYFGLDLDREALYKRIDSRVDEMRERGLLREVEGLISNGMKESLTSMQAIGYKEIIAAIDGIISLDEAFDQIKRATRRYAKRQSTWFRKDDRIRWLDASCERDSLIETVLGELEEGMLV